MIKSMLVLLVFFVNGLYAQVPQGINYQGVARTSNGAAVTNTNISIKFEIWKNSSTVIYSEEHLSVPVGSTGVFAVVIGSKNNSLFQAIDWSAGILSMQLYIDITGGNLFTPIGGLQTFQSTPYSLFSKSVPCSYSGNVLTIGSQSFTLNTTSTTTINGIGSGVAGVTNAVNNFTVDVPTSILSTSGSNLILTQGPFSNSVNISSMPITNIASSGIVSVTTSGTNSFVIGLSNPTFAQSGPTSITGTFPNYTITSPAVITPSIILTNTTSAGPTIVSSGSTFTLNIPPASNSWSLGGNSGISPLVNYLGTTDANDLVFKTNAAERVRIKSGGNVGIGTNTPTALLHVNGTTRLVDGTEGSGKVFTSDASGNASWQNASINTGFSATNPAIAYYTLINNTFVQVGFTTEEFDDGNNFNSNAYTAPTNGVYNFYANISLTGLNNSTSTVQFYLFKNGSTFKRVAEQSGVGGSTSTIAATIKLNAGDVITVWVLQNTGSSAFIDGGSSFFSGHRVY